jgi:hypothetical protein
MTPLLQSVYRMKLFQTLRIIRLTTARNKYQPTVCKSPACIEYRYRTTLLLSNLQNQLKRESTNGCETRDLECIEEQEIKECSYRYPGNRVKEMVDDKGIVNC